MQQKFANYFAIQFFDEESSETEKRFIMFGKSNESRVLIVIHCEREEGNTISARKATKNERKFYEGD